MSVPRNYDQQVRRSLAAKAVWEPGAQFELGDILTTRDGLFNPSGTLAAYGITYQTRQGNDRKLNLKSTGTSETIIQGGVEVKNTEELKADISATIEYKFSGEFEYVLKTGDLDTESVVDVNNVAKAVLAIPEWQHDKWYIVEKIYKAGDWSFLGNRKTSKSIKLSGKGDAIKEFLSVGASVGITATGSIALEMLGAGGALAMRLVRIRKNGSTNRG
jgi:hypothetical protein